MSARARVRGLTATVALLVAGCASSGATLARQQRDSRIASDCVVAKQAWDQHARLAPATPAGFAALIQQLLVRATGYPNDRLLAGVERMEPTAVVVTWTTFCRLNGHGWPVPSAGPDADVPASDDEMLPGDYIDPPDPRDANTIP